MKCTNCKSDFMRARLYIGGLWLCSDCAYLLEYGETARQPWPRPKTTAPPQKETLFPLPPAVPPKRGARARGAS